MDRYDNGWQYSTGLSFGGPRKSVGRAGTLRLLGVHTAQHQCRYTSSLLRRGTDGPLGAHSTSVAPTAGGGGPTGIGGGGTGVLEEKHGSPAFLLLRLQIVASQ